MGPILEIRTGPQILPARPCVAACMWSSQSSARGCCTNAARTTRHLAGRQLHGVAADAKSPWRLRGFAGRSVSIFKPLRIILTFLHYYLTTFLGH
jgi:hypothetical protein